VLLDKGWRVGITADPNAVLPGFDDSLWAVRDAEGSINDVSEEDQPANQSGKIDYSSLSQQRFAWFRLHLNLAPNHGPISNCRSRKPLPWASAPPSSVRISSPMGS
jgi:hypothetical protein